jgi:hypothetical protein
MITCMPLPKMGNLICLAVVFIKSRWFGELHSWTNEPFLYKNTGTTCHINKWTQQLIFIF